LNELVELGKFKLLRKTTEFFPFGEVDGAGSWMRYKKENHPTCRMVFKGIRVFKKGTIPN